MDYQALLALGGIGVTAAGGIVVAILQQGSATRDRIDALRRDLVCQVDGVRAETGALKKDVALLGQRIATLPARVVDEADCRDRHDQLQADLLLAGSARRLIVTGSGGSE